MPASSNSSLELDKGVDFMTSYGSKKKDSSQDEKTIGLDPKVQDENTWDGDNDPLNPYNWSSLRRLTMTALVSIFGLVALLSASMTAPALPKISQDLKIGPTETNLTLSIYILALAFGPLIVSPLSEVIGRKPVYIGCHVWYIIWNTLCPVSKTSGLLITGRFFSGLGAGGAQALPGPIMADIWPVEKRGISYGFVTFAPLLGIAVGPILGGFISEGLDWSWLFWIVSAWDAALVVLSIFLFHESYAPVLLARRTKKFHQTIPTLNSPENEAFTKKLQVAMFRPIQMLFTQPIVPLVSLFLAYNFGIYCIVMTTFSNIWMQKYHESSSISGLNYIAIAIGSTIASQGGGWATDKLWAYLKAKAGGVVKPEYRVPLMIPGTILMPIGLFWYGWSVTSHLHWIMPDLGICIFAIGTMSSQQAAVLYIVDAYGKYSASAVAAVRVLSNLAGFSFPLFANQLYNKLGYGWGNSLLAFVVLGLGVPIPIVLWKWGAIIRNIGKKEQVIVEN